MRKRSGSGWVLGSLVLVVAPAGCAALLGLDQFSESGATTGSGTGSGGEGGTGGGTASSSSDGTTTAASSSAGGTGGSVPTGPWSKAFAGNARGTGVAADAKGNVFVTGYFSGAVKFDENAPVLAVGGEDVFLIKLDSGGSTAWIKRFGGAGLHEAFDARVDSDGSVVITGFSTTPIDFGKGDVKPGIFVAKFDDKGNTLWSIGGGGDSGQFSTIPNGGTDLAIDSQDNILVGGPCADTIDFGTGALPSPTGGQDIFVAKLQSTTGKALWAKRSKGDGIERFGGIAVDSSGSVLIAGTTSSSFIGLNGNEAYNCCGQEAPFVIKLDPSGNAISGDILAGYSGTYKGTYPHSIAANSLGDAFIAGDFSGEFDCGTPKISAVGGKDAFVAKVTAMPTVEWATKVGDSSDQTATNIATGANDTLLIAGVFTGSMVVGSDMLDAAPALNAIFLAGANSAGKYIWGKSYGKSGSNEVGGLAFSASGDVLLTGRFTGSTDFGAGSITAPSGGAFIAKIAAP